MRVSTNHFYNLNSHNMTKLQSDTNKSLSQLATGKKVNTAADDPVAAIAIENLNQQDQRLGQYKSNINLAYNRLSQQESRLGEYENLLMNMRDKMLQGNDGALPAEAREALALDLEEGLKAVVALGNTQDENGNYVFAGHQADLKPFVGGASGAVGFLGDQGRRNMPVAEGVSVPVSESGQRIFMDASNGSGDYRADYAGATMGGEYFIETANIVNPAVHTAGDYSLAFGDDGMGNTTITATDSGGAVLLPTQLFDASQPILFNGMEMTISGAPQPGDSVDMSNQPTADVFTTLQNTVALLRNPAGMSGTNVQAQFAQVLHDFRGAQDSASVVRAESGNYLRSLDTFQNQHESMELVNASAKSTLQDLDYAEAISEFEKQSLALNAVTQTFAKVQDVSLFNYI
ncbi:flagellar hook-associated protein FlgL [uncultured Ferrimonas sp.]|uniref:flagellar hook-associated protein FlgL n=1 Tax=uncultured Ferrimonas sp. TaxID=432640 RepID=UPI002617C9A7|nr:flagellar hook-associated protein FlgL [uncultured Ferrimonas sp.]